MIELSEKKGTYDEKKSNELTSIQLKGATPLYSLMPNVLDNSMKSSFIGWGCLK